MQILDHAIDNLPLSSNQFEIHISKDNYKKLCLFNLNIEKERLKNSKTLIKPNFGKIESYNGYKLVIH